MLKRNLIVILFLLLATADPAGAIKYKGDLESNESITFPEQSSKPASPAATKHKLYFKDDGQTYSLDSSGNERPVNWTGLKNKIINGNFDFWQRGASFLSITITGTRVADRWFVWETGGIGGSVDITRQAFTPGQTDVPGEPEFYLRWATTAGDSYFRIMQRIEDARVCANRVLTFSYYAKADAAVTVTTDGRYNFGSGGSGLLGFDAFDASALTTSWQKFSGTITTPSVTGKTFGTSHFCEIEFQLASGNSRIIDIARVQLEEGPAATAFEERPIALERLLVERYFRILGKGMTGGWGGSTLAVLGVTLDPPMRAACTLTLKDTTPTITEVGVTDRVGSSSSITYSTISADGFRINISGFTGAATGNPAISTEDALLTCDSEL